MSRLADAARSFIGAKFRHRGRSPKMMDCVGLGLLAYEKCGVTLPDYRLYQPDPARQGPNLIDYVKRAMGEPIATEPVKYEDIQDGDLVVIRYVHEPHHVAIVGTHPLGHLSLIHAHGLYGRVLEQGMPPGVPLEKGAVITHLFRKPV